MADSPVIKTERLLIRPFSDEYLTERYVSWLNDIELMQYSEQRHRKHSLESCRLYMMDFKDSPNYLWAVVARDLGLGHIGNINAYVDPFNSLADVGIMIGEKKAHGEGYGFEAFKAVTDFLLKDCNMRKVTAGAMSVNEPMIRIMKKAGMVEDGTRKRHYIWGGREVDILHFAKFVGMK